MKPIIKFSKNWNNKLSCDIFTTIRPHDDKKYFVGAQFDLEVPSKYGMVKMPVKVRRVYSHKLSEIPEVVFITDMATGKDLAIQHIKEVYTNLDCDTSIFDIVVLAYDFKK